MLTGVAAIPANATNNTAMWLGVVASARGYREEVRGYRRMLVPALVVSSILSLIHISLVVLDRRSGRGGRVEDGVGTCLLYTSRCV